MRTHSRPHMTLTTRVTSNHCGGYGPRRLRGKSWRAGVSLVEVLAVIGILLVLVGLALPALQRAREAARALRCRANLRELALAVARYEQLHAVYPPVSVSWWVEIRPGLGDEAKARRFSVYTHVLPFLGYESVYNAINFRVDGFTGENVGVPITYAVEANRTVLHTSLDIFICPSDPRCTRDGSNSYVACVGLLDPAPTRRGWPDSGKGIFHYPPINAAYVTDGLGQTAMLSERLVGDGNYRRPFRHDVDVLGVRGVPLWMYTRADTFASLCAYVHGRASNPLGRREVGRYWMISGLMYTHYNHALPPNSPIGDCVLNPSWGVISARSAHPGRVHVAFGDGHVRAVNETIDFGLWRALATRADGEPIDSF